LAPLDASRYPCGVRSRTLVTVSRRRPRPDPASGLRLASSRTSQGWFVDRFRAPVPVPLDGADLERFLGPHASPRVDAAEPVPPAWDGRRALEASFGGSARRPLLGGRGDAPESVRASADAPAGWPPARCWLSGVGRSETASAHGRARRLA